MRPLRPLQQSRDRLGPLFCPSLHPLQALSRPAAPRCTAAAAARRAVLAGRRLCSPRPRRCSSVRRLRAAPQAQVHLPGYVQDYDKLRAAGADVIACVAVNDPFVQAREAAVAAAAAACGRHAGAAQRRGPGSGPRQRALPAKPLLV